jgi:hypothetical protein
MKTTTVARGFLGAVASLLGVVAVGCSGDMADEATAGNGEIGSVEQAISSGVLNSNRDLANALTSGGGPLTPDPVGRAGSASCVVNHNGVEKMLLVGGETTIGSTVTAEAFLFDPTANSANGEWRQTGSVGTARAFGKAIQNPVDSTQCIFVGGHNAAGTMLNNVDIYDVDTGTWTAQTSGKELDETRANFALVKCSTQKLLAIAGGIGSTRRSSIELWDSTNGFQDTGEDLSDARYDFGIGNYTDNKRWAVAGGNAASSGQFSDRVDAIKATLDENGECTDVVVGNLAALALDEEDRFSLTEGRNGNLVMPTNVTPSASSEEFMVILGDASSALAATYEKFTVDWTASPLQVVSVPASNPLVSTLTNPPALASKPLLVRMNTTLAIVGGESHTGVPLANTIAEYVPTNSAFDNFDATTTEDLVTDRVDHAAEYLVNTSNVFLFAPTGRDSGGSLLTSTEKITP